MSKKNKRYMRKVSEIMEKYDSCYMNGDWEQTLNMFLTFKSDMETIERLEKVLEKDGVFREPIVLSEYFDDYVGINKWVRQVADGTHRLLAAYRLGVEKVLVVDDYDDLSYVTGNLAVTVKFKVDPEEEILDILTENLRSVYLDDENWITASVGSHRGGESILYYDSEDESLIPLINKRVYEKVASIYPDEDFTVATKLDLFDEEDLVHYEDEPTVKLNND